MTAVMISRQKTGLKNLTAGKKLYKNGFKKSVGGASFSHNNEVFEAK